MLEYALWVVSVNRLVVGIVGKLMAVRSRCSGIVKRLERKGPLVITLLFNDCMRTRGELVSIPSALTGLLTTSC